MEKALETLNALVQGGTEFPDAQWKATQQHGVNADALRDAYDDQQSNASSYWASESHSHRVDKLAGTAIQHYKEGNMVDAELLAYEAGRFGIKSPDVIARNEFLKHAFGRGAVDVVQDTKDDARAEAVAHYESPSPF
jgi:hypothetical protein